MLVSAGGVAVIKPSGAGRTGKLKEFSAGVKRDTCEKGSARFGDFFLVGCIRQ